MSDTARCEPPAELRGVDGWHWIKMVDAVDGQPAFWRADSGWWGALATGLRGHTAAETYAFGWRYIAPVTPPAEVAALRADLARQYENLTNYVNENEALRSEVKRLNGVVENNQACIKAVMDDAAVLRSNIETALDHLARATTAPAKAANIQWAKDQISRIEAEKKAYAERNGDA